MNQSIDWMGVDLKSFLTITILFCLLTAGGLYYMYSTEVSALERSRSMTERLHNDMNSQTIAMDLKDLFIDLQLLASSADVRRFMETRTPKSRVEVAKEFLSLCRISKAYDQIRILDNNGMELVRVNYNNGNPRTVPRDQLQDKSNRYYFQESLKLGPGDIYVSPFDLNVENGRIEQPVKPMVRVSMPILDDNEERSGIVILNYLGQKLLADIRGNIKEPMQTMLINDEGYWLLSPDKSQEWAFMYDDRQSISFAALRPADWEKIRSFEKGQFTSEGGEYTFSTITVTPKTNQMVKVNSRQWKVVCFIPRKALDASSFPLRRNYLSIFTGMMIIILFGAITRARFVRSRELGRQQLEEAKLEAENANKAKSEFLARMSHEIRTPMNAVIGLTHLALQTSLSAKQLDYLKKISHSANSLLAIINDILDFSKIEADHLDIDHIDFRLDDVLNNTVNMLGLQAEKKGLEFLMLVKSTVPDMLIGDPLRLGQVLLNLTSNAIKFTDSGEVIISAELIEETEDVATIRFSVQDTGIGITREQKEKLFQPFSQADGTITRKFGGTGLGLVISKRLVELMGGVMQLESEPGKGSKFQFTIPFELQARHKGTHQVYPPDIQGMRVLIVDDSKMSRVVLSKTLESFSFKVSDASDGEEALRLVHEYDSDSPFDLVITDWRMPRMDGIELCRRIRESTTLRNPPKLIILTAYGREEVRHGAEKIGLDGFMLKPFNRSILFDTVMNIFGGEGYTTQETRPLFERRGVPSNVRGARVLLAEDNEINQQVAKEVLETAEVTVSIANNGKEALEMLTEDTYDAVLMDIQMPVMDGFQAVKAIRSTSQIKDTPVIAMTAHALVGDKEKSLLSGMDDYVSKPIDPDILMETLSTWLPLHAGQTSEPLIQGVVEPKRGSTFPKLPGIETESGLDRVRGNEALYAKLLGKFAADCMRDKALLTELIDDNRFSDATPVAHSLKGIAGNLGAERLHQIVMQMEASFQQNQKASSRLVGEFEAEVDRVVKSIQEAFPQTKDSSHPEQAINIKEVEKIKPQLESLAELLKLHDMEARSTFHTLKPTLSEVAPSFASELGDLLDKFDFSGGSASIATFLRQCEEDKDG